MTTNGVLLRRHLRGLVSAGLTGVNISLDTLKPERFQQVTRRSGLSDVLDAISAAIQVLPSVKVNVVAMRGVNEDEVLDFAELTLSLPITVRFIELMPFDADQVWKTGRFLGVERLKAILHDWRKDLEPVGGSATETWTMKARAGVGQVALIPAFTRSLCGQCNRIRVTADGRLRNCLYSDTEYSLRELLRSEASDDEVLRMIREGILAKARDGWVAQREGTQRRARVSMTQIGG